MSAVTPDWVHALPAVNAGLNATATVLLTTGFVLIRLKRERAHRTCMLSAFTVSVVFLCAYVLHKVMVQGVHTPFQGEGLWRPLYYTMLLTHVLLAMAVPVLVLRTLLLAIRDQRQRHRKWARWTFPIWYYVSVTGVLIYFFLYHWF